MADAREIVCNVCPRACELSEGETGLCNIRKNVSGENVDGFYGFLRYAVEPSPVTASTMGVVIMPGCNLNCPFCQTPYASFEFHGDVTGFDKCSFEELIGRLNEYGAKALAVSGGEAALHHEYTLGLARLARERSWPCMLATNGYVNEWLMRELSTAFDMIQVGVKCCLSPQLYQGLGADRNMLFSSIEIVWKNCTDGRVVDLIGPHLVPSDDSVREFGSWLRTIGATDIPYLIRTQLAPEGLGASEKSGLLPNDNCFDAFQRVSRAARILVGECGLTDVMVVDAWDMDVRHYPSCLKAKPEEWNFRG